MASATISKLLSSSPRAPGRVDSPEHDRAPALTPTRQAARPTSLPPTNARIGLAQTNGARGRDARGTGQGPVPPPPWYFDSLSEADRLRRSLPDLPYTRNNTGFSTVLSQDHSPPWSEEDSETTTDDYYLPPAAPLRRVHAVPPRPPPMAGRGGPGFLPPPPWHPPVGVVGSHPPTAHIWEPAPAHSESASEDSEGEDMSSLPHDSPWRRELQEKIEKTRQGIRQLRHALAKKRKELQGLRHRQSELDNALLQLFRPHLMKQSRFAVLSMDTLGKRLREMQSMRDEYYTAESAYEAMESDLDHEEFKLETLEVELHQEDHQHRQSRQPRGIVAPQAAIPPPPPAMTAPGEAEQQKHKDGPRTGSRPPSPVTLLGISGDRPEDIHPLYEELLTAAGDRQLALEYAEDLDMLRDKILYDLEIESHRKRVRDGQGNQISEEDLQSLRTSLAKVPTDAAEFEARFGISITEDELDFLRSYGAASERARRELEAASENLEHLRDLCLKKGVMRKHASYHEELAIYAGCPDWFPSPADGNMTIDPPLPPPPPSPPPPPPPGRSPSHSQSRSPLPSAAKKPPSLAHPRFPILLSNPSYVLEPCLPAQALERALRLPQDDPAAALRRAECLKEVGISTLMTRADGKADYINRWLIHRLRTCPMEAELLLAVAEGVFRVVNLRRWQEEVLYYWRLDGAAAAAAAATTAPAATAAAAGGSDAARDAGTGTRAGTAPAPGLGKSVPGGAAGADVDLLLDGGSAADSKVNSVIEGQGKVRSEAGPEAGGASVNVGVGVGVGVGVSGGGRVAKWQARSRSVRSFG